ncbi:hypothetical protein MMC22_005420 [Lobaria immixta]|nr:hypothetical protein [Lobaria immixta]
MTSSWVYPKEDLIKHAHRVVSHDRSELDPLQNYDQVCLVIALSEKIIAAERVSRPEIRYNSTIITLSVLLQHLSSNRKQGILMHTPFSWLRSFSCPVDIAHAVHDIVNAVCFDIERDFPSLIQSTLQAHPELAVVQDAHRLTSIGAIEIGRFFTFEGTAEGTYRHMDQAMKHQMDICDDVARMMKTQEGKRMAAVRTRRLKDFWSWWEQERNTNDY